jgi:hypothetical protein
MVGSPSLVLHHAKNLRDRSVSLKTGGRTGWTGGIEPVVCGRCWGGWSSGARWARLGEASSAPRIARPMNRRPLPGLFFSDACRRSRSQRADQRGCFGNCCSSRTASPALRIRLQAAGTFSNPLSSRIFTCSRV